MRSTDPRTRRTIEKLLGAGEEVFGEHAVDAVTVEQLAARAGVAVGSIYNHFGSKHGLYAAVVERALDADREHMDRAYADGRGPVEQLYAAAEEYLAFYLRHPDFFRMLAFPNAPGTYAAGRDLGERLARLVDEQNDRMVVALRDGISTGALRAGDPQRTATVLWASLNGVISLGWRPDGLRRTESELRELLRATIDVVANGLLAGAAPVVTGDGRPERA